MHRGERSLVGGDRVRLGGDNGRPTEHLEIVRVKDPGNIGCGQCVERVWPAPTASSLAALGDRLSPIRHHPSVHVNPAPSPPNGTPMGCQSA